MIELICLALLCASWGAPARSSHAEVEAGAKEPEQQDPAVARETSEQNDQVRVTELPVYRVTVSARRFVTEEPTSFPQEVLGEEARRLPMIDDDLYRAHHLIPGVQADDYSARFSLRGGERDEVTVLLDGVPIFDPFHLQDYGGAISAIDLGIVERSTLLADGFPARYGERMGGVLDVEIKEPGHEHELSAGFDLLNAHSQASGPLGDGGYLVSARRGYLDLFIAAWAENVDFRPSYWDLFTKVEHGLSDRDRVSVYGLWAADSNEIRRAGVEPDLRSTYHNGQAWARWQRRLGNGGSMEASAALGRATRDRGEGAWGWDLRRIYHAMLSQEWRIPLGTRLGDLRWGGRLRFSQGDYDYFVSDLTHLGRGEELDLKVKTELMAIWGSLFLQHDARPLTWLRTTVGLRMSRVQGVGSFNLGPRLGLALLPHRTLTLRAAWGLYHQPVTPHELPVETGTSQLGPAEVAQHRVLGLLWRPGPWLHLRLEGYQRIYEQLSGHLRDLGSPARVYTDPVGAEAIGVEIEARGYPLAGRLGWLVGYTCSLTEEWGEEGEPYPRTMDQTHALSVGLDLDLGWPGRLSAAYRYHSGRPYTPAIGIEERGAGSAPRLVYASPGSARMPSFHSLDARLSRDWSWESFRLRGYLQVVNATFRQNVQEVVYELREGTEGWELTRHEEHYFPLLPTLGLEGRW